MCRLRSYDVNPPGNYSYVQTQGIKREFPSVPLIESLAQDISAFRAGNGLPRASIKESLEDADHYNAERIGCHRNWCVDVNAETGEQTIALAQSHPLITPCKGCGAPLVI